MVAWGGFTNSWEKRSKRQSSSLGFEITADGVCSHEIKTLVPWKKSYDKPRQQRHYFADKCLSSQSYGFSSSHVEMWVLDHKEGWASKNWWFWTVVLEKTLESPLDCKETKPVNPKGNQSWIFIRRTDAEAEYPVLWPSDAKSRLIRKDPDAGERLKAGAEGDDRGRYGWMASSTQWTWVWAGSGGWWRAGKSSVLQSMGSQRVLHNWATEQLLLVYSSQLTHEDTNTLQRIKWCKLVVGPAVIPTSSDLYFIYSSTILCYMLIYLILKDKRICFNPGNSLLLLTECSDFGRSTPHSEEMQGRWHVEVGIGVGREEKLWTTLSQLA